ncbi:23S rRNA (adenine(2503)-C(2))-methyltransferase RlmN [Aestuariispira insulae]|uniref:Dual-specificity RNA methyltransferase RlmN n=1 Tax=Aestuariispira insulae TaxID=1461337 RepID=A0A3D9HEV3_9PROT|nr:23S rRNA m(2)A-2503 methyltransferase [Aestuariispira insulae]
MENTANLTDFMPGGAHAPAPDPRPNLIGMSKDDIIAEMEKLGEPKFRAQQIFQWIYNRGVLDFDDMTNVAKPLRSKLKELYRMDRPQVTTLQKSEDGTIKWLLRYEDGNEAETVFIPDGDRGTLCVSSQVGCTLTCKFCHTGTQKLVRNLTPGDIVGQVMLARDELGEWPSPGEDRRLTNIVMMGMGEPLYNTDNVIKALKVIMAEDGIQLSKRRVTLSTSGVVPEMERVGAETGALLAVSLHAVHDELRNDIVPINRKYNIETLMEAVRNYPGLGNSNRVTWEYVMLKGVNDSEADARRLVQLIKGIPSKFNLIPFNAWPGSPYECSDDAQIKKFADILWNAGYSAPIRKPRGRDILAACGQLKSESERIGKRERMAMEAMRREKEEAAGIALPV